MKQYTIQCLKSETIDSGAMYGQFLIDSLNSGQGITNGNLLRRVLLGDLEGIAITGVRIAGVKDEFSLIPGVREDILEILLNLKGVILKSNIVTRQFGRLRIQGPAVITASSIQLPPEIETINPNHYIATISEQTNLELELKIESGTGYLVLNDDSQSNSNDFLNIDVLFTPVKNVNYEIRDSYKVDEKITEILDLEITTDGSITPLEALNKSSQILQALFGGLIIDESKNNVSSVPTIETELDILIEELQLSVRSYNCLKRVNILTIADLVQYSVKELKEIKNFGQKSANEVVKKLQDRFDISLS